MIIMKKIVIFIFALIAVSCNRDDNDRVFVDLLNGVKIEEIYIDGDIDVKIEQGNASSNSVRVLADSRDVYSVDCKMLDKKLYLTLNRKPMGDTPVSLVINAESLKSLSIKNACNATLFTDFVSNGTDLTISSLSTLTVNGKYRSNSGLTAFVESKSELSFLGDLVVLDTMEITADSGSEVAVKNLVTSKRVDFLVTGSSVMKVGGESLFADGFNYITVNGGSTFAGVDLSLVDVDISLDGASTAEISVARDLKLSVNSVSALKYKGGNINIIESDISVGSSAEQIK